MNLLQDGLDQLARCRYFIADIPDASQQVLHRCRHCQTPIDLRRSRNGRGYFAYHPKGSCVASERFRHGLGNELQTALEALNA